MSFRYNRRYTGKVQGIIFDWAGTTVDYGCFAPTSVFIEAFRAQGVNITLAESRAPMGAHKRDHITAIINMPRVAAEWESVHGAPPSDADIQTIYEGFLPRQVEVVSEFADLIPGTVEAIAALRERGLQIGSCTGYTRAIMDALIPVAKDKGYAPDFVVTADEVAAGRPAPWMALKNAEMMGVYPMNAVVKVGDTVTDILEGLNAGMWTIGLAATGNEMGLTQDEIAQLSEAERAVRLAAIYDRLYQAGAHFVVDDISCVPAVIDQIDLLNQQGICPHTF